MLLIHLKTEDVLACTDNAIRLYCTSSSVLSCASIILMICTDDVSHLYCTSSLVLKIVYTKRMKKLNFHEINCYTNVKQTPHLL